MFGRLRGFFIQKKESEYRSGGIEEHVRWSRVIFLMVILVGGFFFTVWAVPLRRVNTNMVALKWNTMSPEVNTEKVYREGLHWVGPWGRFYEYPRNIQKYTFSADHEADGPMVEVRTEDGMKVAISGWFQYRVNIQELGKFYRDFGTFEEHRNIMYAPVRSVVNSLFSDAEAEYVYGELEEFSIRFEEKLTELLENPNQPYYVSVIGAAFRHFDFPDDYEKAQEDKLIAEQRIAKAQFELETKRVEARQAVVTAEGLANSTIKIAEGQAEAAFKVREQMNMTNAEYLQWLYLQQLGVLDNPQIVIITGDEVPEFLIPLADEGSE